MDDTSPIEPSALRDLGGRLADLLDGDHFNTVEAAFLLPALQELRDLRARIAELERELREADAINGGLIPKLDAALRENAELREALRGALLIARLSCDSLTLDHLRGAYPPDDSWPDEYCDAVAAIRRCAAIDRAREKASE